MTADSAAARAVVVSGVPEGLLDCGTMADKLVIHFQRARSGGGDVAAIQYPTSFRGVAFVMFEEQKDAARVLQVQQVLQDEALPKGYPLTVFQFTQDVFCYAFAEVDFSLFSDHERLIEDLQATHRCVRISSLQPHGRALLEGPFKALKEVREALLRAAGYESRLGSREVQLSPERSGKPSVMDPPGQRECSVWVDTNVFRYIQHFRQEDFDLCLRKYDVAPAIEVQGEVTKVTLSTKGQPCVGAQAELELLIAGLQPRLRTQIIQHTSDDRRQREELLRICKESNHIHDTVLIIPSEAHIEIVGPSSSCFLFCQMVEGKLKAASADGSDTALGAAASSSSYNTGRIREPYSLRSGPMDPIRRPEYH
ncbi:RBM43 protein, partial [Amia calva]|nr:RBM43 protein [Amia calva]